MAKKKENVTEEIKEQESTVKAPVKKAAAKKVKESEAKTQSEADIENEEALKAQELAEQGKTPLLFAKNDKLSFITDDMLIAGCDIGSETHYIRAIDVR